MLVTDSKITADTQTMLSVGQIAEVIKSLSDLDKAVLVVRSDKDTPSFIKIEKANGKSDLVLIAPRTAEETKKGKKEEKKPKKAEKKETNEEETEEE